MDPFKLFFPGSYTESRSWFREQINLVLQYWPHAELVTFPLDKFPDLSIDCIRAPCTSSEGQMLVISTGLHGAEGFTGTAVLHHFLASNLRKLNHDKTGLLLIHALNPWGMSNRRRTNAQNVDLNRNFRHFRGHQESIANPGYSALQNTLYPARPLGNYILDTFLLGVKVAAHLARTGIKTLREAVLLGQLDDPFGPYYGGHSLEQETRVAWELLTSTLEAHLQVIHIDIHTGYGRRQSMSLVNSPREKITPEEYSRCFRYPHVVRADPEAFYTIQGDMIDALYAWVEQTGSQTQYYGTAFEFGTMGDGFLAQLRSLRAIIFENQVSHHGSIGATVEARVRQDFRNLFDPPSETWRRAAIESSDQALSGILHWFGLVAGSS